MFEVVLRHLSAEAVEDRAHGVFELRVPHEFNASEGGNGFTREVVTCRAQTAGNDDGISAIGCRSKSSDHAVMVVADDDVMVDVNPDGG